MENKEFEKQTTIETIKEVETEDQRFERTREVMWKLLHALYDIDCKAIADKLLEEKGSVEEIEPTLYLSAADIVERMNYYLDTSPDYGSLTCYEYEGKAYLINHDIAKEVMEF